jgi:hypothetical protein
MKTMKTYVRIIGLRPEIWSWDVSNTKQEYWPLEHDIRLLYFRFQEVPGSILGLKASNPDSVVFLYFSLK